MIVSRKNARRTAMQRFLNVVMLFAVGGFTQSGMAEPPYTNPVKLEFAANSVDFTGDGVADLVMLSHRENFNAHSFDVASFYVLVEAEDGHPRQWNIVPVMAKDKEKLEVIVSGGADCVLHDFRLLAGSRTTPAALILADRDMGNSYADRGTVTFTYYTLASNTEGDPGSPRYSFEQSRVTTSKGRYCDVGKAFQRELGIGAYIR